MKVLSLFDGMSCGQIALSKLGVKVDKYHASEIDKYAIEITQKNFPQTVQLGDICKIDAKDFMDVDLMLAGSPCQGFSFAGSQLAFDDPRSALFFEFVRLLKEIKPKYFLLENVRMKKEFLEVITEQVSSCYTASDVDDEYVDMFGNVRFEPHFINSSLLSAQSRQRYYWTNIPNIQQPEDKGVVLADVLEDGYDSERDKAHCIDANYYKGANVKQYKKKHRRQLVNKPKQVGVAVDIKGHDILKRVYSEEGKSPTLTTMGGGHREPKIVTGGAMRARSKNKDGKHVDWKETKPQQMLELRKDEKSNSISTVSKDSVVVEKSHPIKANYYKSSRANFENDRSKGSKFSATGVQQEDLTWRKLTPLECERLQTVPDGYTEGVSNTQRYRMLGNGWTVDVIAHILTNMEVSNG
jgi:DNA-cytosine methyltransferase